MTAQVRMGSHESRGNIKTRQAYTTYADRHNDRQYNITAAQAQGKLREDGEIEVYLIREIEIDGERRLKFDKQGKDTDKTISEHQKDFYKSYFADYVESRNQRYIKSRHKERCGTTEDLRTDIKTAPAQTIFTAGRVDPETREKVQIPKNVLLEIVVRYYNELYKQYGEHYKPTDIALHDDENGVTHIHGNAVYVADDTYIPRNQKSNPDYVPTETYKRPLQEKALEQMGIEKSAIHKDDPKGKYAKMRTKYEKEMERVKEGLKQNPENTALKKEKSKLTKMLNALDTQYENRKITYTAIMRQKLLEIGQRVLDERGLSGQFEIITEAQPDEMNGKDQKILQEERDTARAQKAREERIQAETDRDIAIDQKKEAEANRDIAVIQKETAETERDTAIMQQQQAIADAKKEDAKKRALQKERTAIEAEVEKIKLDRDAVLQIKQDQIAAIDRELETYEADKKAKVQEAIDEFTEQKFAEADALLRQELAGHNEIYNKIMAQDFSEKPIESINRDGWEYGDD